MIFSYDIATAQVNHKARIFRRAAIKAVFVQNKYRVFADTTKSPSVFTMLASHHARAQHHCEVAVNLALVWSLRSTLSCPCVIYHARQQHPQTSDRYSAQLAAVGSHQPVSTVQALFVTADGRCLSGQPAI